MKERFAAAIKTRTRDEWAEPPRAWRPASRRCWTRTRSRATRISRARGSFVEAGGIVQPAPAPRFSRTPAALSHLPAAARASTRPRRLADWGFGSDDIAALLEAARSASW